MIYNLPEIQKQVKRLSSGMKDNNLIPITSFIRMNIGSDFFACTTDGINFVSTQISADVGEWVIVDKHKFCKLVLGFTGDTLSLDTTDKFLKINCGDSVYKLPKVEGEPDEIFPLPSFGLKGLQQGKINVANFKQTVNHLRPCISTESNGMDNYFFDTNHSLTVDGFKVCRASSISDYQLYLRPSTVDILSKIDWDCDSIDYDITDTHILFSSKDTDVITTINKSEGNVLKVVDSLFEKKEKEGVLVASELLASALNRLVNFSADETDKKPAISFTLAEEEVKLETKSAQESILCKDSTCMSAQFVGDFNPSFVLNCIKGLAGHDMFISVVENQCMFISAKDVEYIIMLIRR